MEIDGKSKILVATPVISTSIYASGDQMGVAVKLADIFSNSSGTSSILSGVLLDKAKQNSSIDVLFFNKSPVITSVDNAPLDISDDEMAEKYIGTIAFVSADYKDLASNSTNTRLAIGVLLQGNQFHDVWVVFQCRGTPTYTSTSDLVMKLGVFQD